jgi:hypothetical protein
MDFALEHAPMFTCQELVVITVEDSQRDVLNIYGGHRPLLQRLLR